MARVGVIILNWNGKDFTLECLECFRRFNHSYEIVLVDNNSTDDSVEVITKDYPEVTILALDENLGFAGGNNVGMEYCLNKGMDYVILLNNDTVFDFDFIAPLVNKMDTDPKLGGIQPRIFFNHDRTLIWNGGGIFYKWAGYARTIGEGVKDGPKFNLTKETDWITGCAFMVRSSVLREVGLLDDRFFIYHEDVDWSLRIRKAGYRLLYEPSSVIYHWAGSSRKAKQKGKEGFQHPLNHYLNQRNRFWVVRKNLAPHYALSATFYHFVQASVFLVYFLMLRRFTKFGATVKGLQHGFGRIRKVIPTFTV